jgi:predicted nucleic acid-binding Zn ribbon protein
MSGAPYASCVLVAASITRALPAMLALLIGVAGWFYLFYSRAATSLSVLEDQKRNDRRATLRRFGGIVMLALAVLISVGAYGYDLDLDRQPRSFYILWLVVIALLMLIVVLAFIDVRLTVKLKDALRQQRKERL